VLILIGFFALPSLVPGPPGGGRPPGQGAGPPPGASQFELRRVNPCHSRMLAPLELNLTIDYGKTLTTRARTCKGRTDREVSFL
jgi:hypothetical protein